MKFARYLQDTQTPEWKRAYIDYRGLKKRIGKIRQAKEAREIASESTVNLGISHARQDSTFSIASSLQDNGASDSEDRDTIHGLPAITQVSPEVPSIQPRPSLNTHGNNNRQHKRGFSGVTIFRSRRSTLGGGRTPQKVPVGPLPLHELLPLLNTEEREFFYDLDCEHEKIETFYLNREKEMRARSKQLRDQLNELADHRKAYHAAQAESSFWPAFKASATVLKTPVASYLPNFRFRLYKRHDAIPDKPDIKGKSKVAVEHSGNLDDSIPSGSEDTAVERGSKHWDPEEYTHAKKKLKKALQEHYRGVELLHNYRILNVTGFRKALKKFEKNTGIPAQQAYMSEIIEPSALGSATVVNEMLKEIEDIYAERFANGNKKKALQRLRSGMQQKSHHFNTFTTGIAIGTAIPAFATGIYQSYQPLTRQQIPAYGGLLIVYSAFFIPVIFALLVGLNLMSWSRSRINYQFIFELDIRTRLDYREYFQVPALLLTALCYSFWLSFARIGYPSVNPTIWPMVWLGFAGAVMLNPFPFLFKSSRYWTIHYITRLFLSGTRRVEFTDFWLGDQFCSLTYTLSNLYFVGCVYKEGFDIQWQSCLRTSHWVVSFVLGALPLLIRLIQSIRRYADSRLSTHLVNGGKYGAGVLAIALYSYWRHHGADERGSQFIAWCIFQTFYAIYACTWDFLMDWSILKPHARFYLLRDNLIYTNYVYVYYIAIVTNVLIRFIWIIYIPKSGLDFPIRAFIVGVLEMMRRWQWNFFRLENEHLGNMDQYRVTREVPLPYNLNEHPHEDDDDDERQPTNRSWLSLRRRSAVSQARRQAAEAEDSASSAS